MKAHDKAIKSAERPMISEPEAARLVSVLMPGTPCNPVNDKPAFALMRILQAFVDCEPSEVENVQAIFEQAIFQHTDAFGRALDSFSKSGDLNSILKPSEQAA